MAAGIAFGAWTTRGFRRDLVNFDLPAEEEASRRICNLAIG
jgi:hypothetical protein